MDKVFLYDTTLRDGAQHEGISFSLEDKLNITRKLDRLGIHYIEGGWPGSNPKDAEYFERVRGMKLQQAKIAAFGSTRRAGLAIADDPQVQALLDAGTPVITLVGKSWTLHVRDVLRTTPEENLHMIADTVAYLKAAGKEIIYDAEHFFDGYNADPDYAFATIQAAQDAGADWIVLADTNGGNMYWRIEEVVAEMRRRLQAPLGIHAHNDSELAVANTLAAVRAGVTQVQGTINGIGERVGNANLCSIIPNLKLKMDVNCVSDEQLRMLTEVSRFVSEAANVAHNPQLPYVGETAFAHKGGIHVSAILRNVDSYQHTDPALVGNEKRVLVSELSGRGNLRYKAEELGVEITDSQVKEALAKIKELENKGFFFEGADASVELLLERTKPGYRSPFELVDYTTVVEHRQKRGLLAEATVKIRVNGEIVHTAAEGNGPVNALDKALRKAMLPYYPQLAAIQLTDYKVRILDADAATGATTRVMITTRNGKRSWITVGSSANIIEASWQALVDGLEYALSHSEDKA